MSSRTLPELGPMLGRLIAAPGEKTPLEEQLDQVRLELLTALFSRGAEARRLLETGDEAGARKALGEDAWLAAWQQAVSQATRLLLAELEQRIRDAAVASRYGAKRLAVELPDEATRRALAARLAASGIPLEDAARRLADPSFDWLQTIRLVSGELESAWERLLAELREELAHWDRIAVRIAAWRRPWRPLALVLGSVLAAATWLGLVLGGYLAAPPWLRPLTDWIWGL